APPGSGRGLHEEHAVLVGHAGGRHDEPGGERAEDQVDLVAGDEGLVVGDDAGGVGRVVEDVELDLTAEEPAVLVDDVGPGLVAALHALARLGEVTGQRQRDPDDDRVLGAAVAVPTTGAVVTVAATGRQREHRDRTDTDPPGQPLR